MRRIGIDTNILLRLLVNDDPEQRKAALEFGKGLNSAYVGVVTLISLVEMDWALRTQYGYSRGDSVDAIGKVTRIRGIEIEAHDSVVRALRHVQDRNADLADALIAERLGDLGCEVVKTFDSKAAARIPGMELLA